MTIFEAAAAGDQERVKQLCKQSPATVDSRSAEGRTPLYFAAAAGQVDMVNQLLMLGADLSAGSESPIVAVADYSDPMVAADMAVPLLGNGSNPNVNRKDGITALHLAAARGNVDVARLLIHRGAMVDPKDSIIARAVPDASKIERVYFDRRYAWSLRGDNPKRDDTQGLPQATINKFVTFSHFDPATVKQMHKDTPDLLATRSTWDELSIEAGAHMGLVSLTQYMADAGAPVSTCTAIVLGLTDVVRKMIAEDRNRLRERGAHDFSPLMYTAFGNEQAEIAEILLEAGADPKTFGFGSTALHLAAGKGHFAVAALLIKHGADVNAVSKSRKGPGPTPLAVARERKQEKMVEFLASRGGRA